MTCRSHLSIITLPCALISSMSKHGNNKDYPQHDSICSCCFLSLAGVWASRCFAPRSSRRPDRESYFTFISCDHFLVFCLSDWFREVQMRSYAKISTAYDDERDDVLAVDVVDSVDLVHIVGLG